jgi:putative two-component system response regulator
MNRGLFSDIIDEDYIENISLSAPLHDLWKILVDSSILLKPWKLTEQEFNMMMWHSNLWALIIESEKSKYKWEDLEKLFNIAVNVARHHHEKYNGKWYPDWLKWEKIPLEARIIAVVDVFDALKSNRPYKNEWSDEDIIIEFKKLRWQHFDPIITDIFLELYDEFLQIRQSNDD